MTPETEKLKDSQLAAQNPKLPWGHVIFTLIWASLLVNLGYRQSLQGAALWVHLGSALGLPLALLYAFFLRRSLGFVLYLIASVLVAYRVYWLVKSFGLPYAHLSAGFSSIMFILCALSYFFQYVFIELLKTTTFGRQHERFEVFRFAYWMSSLEENQPPKEVPILIRDISRSGVCVSVPKDQGEPLFNQTSDSFSFPLRLGKKTILLKGQLRWTRVRVHDIDLGLACDDADTLALLATELGSYNGNKRLLEALQQKWTRTIKRTAISMTFIFGMGSGIVPACGGLMDPSEQDQRAEKLVQVGFGVGLDSKLRLSEAFDTYTVTISQCLSGFTRSLGPSDPPLKLHYGDLGCVASMDEIVYSNQVFTMPNGETFQTSEGSINEFKSPSGQSLFLSVINQLPSVIGDAPSILFAISGTFAGAQSSFVGPPVSGITLSLDNPTVEEENAPTLQLTVARDRYITGDLVVHLALSGTATPGLDYSGLPSQVTIPAGANETTISFQILNDTEPEVDETIIIELAPGSGYYTGGVTEGVVILDTDQAVPATGLVMQLLGDSGIQTGSQNRVTQWLDQSGSGNHADQGTTSFQPLFNPGGPSLPQGIQFDGVNDLLTIANNQALNSGSSYLEKTLILFLTTGADIASPQVIYEQGGGVRGFNLVLQEGKLYFTAWNKANDGPGTPWGPTHASLPVDQNESYLVRMSFGGSSDTLALTLNSTTTATKTGIGPLHKHTGGIALGAINNDTVFYDDTLGQSGSFYSGSVSELYYYNSLLTSTQAVGIENLIADKYNFSTSFQATVQASPLEIYESSPTPSIVTITLNKPFPDPITFDISLSGSAVEGADYEISKTSVTIPPFSLSSTSSIAPIDDTDEEGVETITYQITTSHPDITIQGEGTSSVNLIDDEVYSPFSPHSMWYKMEPLNASEGNFIATWIDSSPENLPATAAQNNQRPRARFSYWSTGAGGLEFDGSRDLLSIPNSAQVNMEENASFRAIGIVIRTKSDITTPQVIYEQGGGTRGLNLYIRNGLLFWNAYNLANDDGQGGWGPVSVSTPIMADSTYIIACDFNSTLNRMRLIVNGQAPIESQANIRDLYAHSGNIALGGAGGTTILDDGTSTNNSHFEGVIGEMIYYYEPVLEAEWSTMQSYLQNKYEP